MQDVQTLTLEQKQLAAALAPAIRSLLRTADSYYQTVTFTLDASLTAASFQQRLSAAGLKGFLLGDASTTEADLYSQLALHMSDNAPQAVGISGLGFFTAGLDKPAADRNAAALKTGRSVPDGASALTVPTAGRGRLTGKVSIVTGSAQGFGEGIAREMAAQGANVVIADLNEPLADQVAADICTSFGSGSAVAMKVDVSSEDSIWQLVQDTVLTFGGLDIFVSNAGVLKAGSLEEMDLKSFEFVTRINYTAFFLCTKFAARPMKIQHRFDADFYGDIIQINSKSGLEGSMKNFAYAGGKFGGIGLTQSFAKELVEYNIKVNAVCPGNYYEGPLWSDPDKGLFVQYLRTGKVPGAKTVEDVYNFYVGKVPMKKGCSPRDVARAIFYLVEQTNETGQALPVTGGQNMLH